jgi:hypothetical protein
MNRMDIRCISLLLTTTMAVMGMFVARASADEPAIEGAAKELPMQPGRGGMIHLPGKPPKIADPYPGFVYDVKLEKERFYLYVPPTYEAKKPHGLVVFIHADNAMELPRDWKPTLAKHKLLYIAPQNVGNNFYTCWRVGMAVVAATKIMELYNIDAQRVYVTGLSGGARAACTAAFFHPTLFRGAFPICGAEFPARVPRVHAPQDNAYGVFEGDEKLLEKVRSDVGFALITGSKDFVRGYILDLYEGGFAAQKYRAKLFDVPGMNHEIASAATVDRAIRWLDGKKP